MSGPTQQQIDQVSAKLGRLDPGIAAVFKTVAPGGITEAEMVDVMKKVIDAAGQKGVFISPDEAEAIVDIIDSQMLDPGVFDKLKTLINSVDGLKALFEGTAAALKVGDKKDDKELANVYAAIALKNTGKIKFQSPGSGHTYDPVQYQAIAEIIKDGKIDIVLVDERQLLERTQGPNGAYFATNNQLVLMKNKQGTYYDPVLIVHELTHAIQDFYDVNSIVKNVEADAYIAAAISVYGPKKTPKAMFDAAKHVIDGTATPTNDAWIKAYGAVVSLVESDPTYAARKDDPTKDFLEAAGTETKTMQDALAKLAQAVTKKAAKKTSKASSKKP